MSDPNSRYKWWVGRGVTTSCRKYVGMHRVWENDNLGLWKYIDLSCAIFTIIVGFRGYSAIREIKRTKLEILD
jgi:hypothetical protein